MPAKIVYIERCPACNGKRKVTQHLMHNSQVYTGEGMCAICKGKGMIIVKKENCHNDDKEDKS